MSKLLEKEWQILSVLWKFTHKKVDLPITSYALLLVKVACLHSCSGHTYFDLLPELTLNKTAFKIPNLGL